MTIMDPNAMPAGYVNLGYVAMHVAKLRKFTTDVQRFIKWTPTAVALAQMPTGTKASFDFVGKSCKNGKEMDELLATLQETADLQNHLLGELKAHGDAQGWAE